MRINPLTTIVPHHIETSQLIWPANVLTGFYIMGNTGGLWVKKITLPFTHAKFANVINVMSHIIYEHTLKLRAINGSSPRFTSNIKRIQAIYVTSILPEIIWFSGNFRGSRSSVIYSLRFV